MPCPAPSFSVPSADQFRGAPASYSRYSGDPRCGGSRAPACEPPRSAFLPSRSFAISRTDALNACDLRTRLDKHLQSRLQFRADLLYLVQIVVKFAEVFKR